jgi:hypothetical protein
MQIATPNANQCKLQRKVRQCNTLTLFGLHTPAKLFDADPEGTRALARERAISSLNQYLLDPIESVLVPCRDGSLAIEVKSPLDLERDISLPRGNIFHRNLNSQLNYEGNQLPRVMQSHCGRVFGSSSSFYDYFQAGKNPLYFLTLRIMVFPV